MSDIFVSYRRADAGWAGRLLECLEDRFDVFFDTEDIDSGDLFPERIESALAACRVCCVAIGPEWGKPRQLRRLADTRDWVRQEIVSVLGRPRVRVIPLLLGGAALPEETALPEPLRPLLQRNAYILSHDKWKSDCDELIRRMEGWLSTQAPEGTARGEPPPVLPFLCDRVPQEDGLVDQLAAQGHRHPVCIVHGYLLEAHEGFLDRLRHRQFLDDLFGSREVGAAVCRLEWNREAAGAGLYQDLLKRALRRNVLKRLTATEADLQALLANPGQPLVLVMQVSWADLQACGEGFLPGITQAWHGLFAADAPAWPMLLWINVAYDAMDQALATDSLSGVLPRLGPITQGHVQEWLGQDEVRRFALGQEAQVLALTQDSSCCFEPGKLHMQDFADRVRRVLAGHRA